MFSVQGNNETGLIAVAGRKYQGVSLFYIQGRGGQIIGLKVFDLSYWGDKSLYLVMHLLRYIKFEEMPNIPRFTRSQFFLHCLKHYVNPMCAP